MAYQVGKQSRAAAAATKPAKGNAPATGAPGPTPAPLKPYANPDLEAVRVFQPGYGTNSDNSPSSINPGTTRKSALGQELQRVGGMSDGGDHLGQVEQHGTARDQNVDLISSQLRTVSNKPYPTTPGMTGASRGPMVPSALGAPATPLPKGPAENER